MSVLKKLNFPACVTVGTVAELLLTLVLLVPVAAILDHQLLKMPSWVILPPLAAGLSVLFITSLLVRTHKKQALAIGASCGAMYGALASLLCALGGKDYTFGPWLLWLFIATLAGGILGASLGIGRTARKRHRRRG